MKDPAILLYPSDFNDGTQDFTNEEVGAYLRLLLFQFSQGHLPLERIRKKLSPDFERLWGVIQVKFVVDATGLYYNQRLELEQTKRKKYSESRRNNISKRYEEHKKNISTTYVEHMENENTVLNINKEWLSISDFERQGYTFGLSEDLEKSFNEFLRYRHERRDKITSGQVIEKQLKEMWGKSTDDKVLIRMIDFTISKSAKNIITTLPEFEADFEGGGLDDNVDIMKRFEELKNRKK